MTEPPPLSLLVLKLASGEGGRNCCFPEPPLLPFCSALLAGVLVPATFPYPLFWICHLASGQPIEAMVVGTANNETIEYIVHLRMS
ncbi:hypothetical protein PIB30_073725 [Stylosanthes scabra]|uniref:Uncharacterized protein n=1 Tax=Stylosanthes scabra TaxID=79078 RepID=A0ABU6WPA9_9FABA|nr:hypothetical protein [Stylosanthes scabra]